MGHDEAGPSIERRAGGNVTISRRRVLGVAGGLAGAALLTGTGTGLAAPGRLRSARQVGGGTLKLSGHQSIPGLSPNSSTASVPFVAITQLHNALYELDETITFNPVLAADMPQVSQDGLTYTVPIRSGVMFQDGTTLTSADVKYTYDWHADPANASLFGADLALLTGVDAPDPATVVFRLKQPFAAFLARIGNIYIVPSAYHKQVGDQAYAQKPMGTGAFTVSSFVPDGSSVFDAWDGHFRGRPKVDHLQIDIVPEASVRAEAMRNGDSDNSIWPLTPEDDAALAQDKGFQTFSGLSDGVNHFPLNLQNPILADVRVRQAMMFAIDRQSIVDDVFLGQGQVATSNLSPVSKQYYTDQVTAYPFDPDKAAQLLDAAGLVKGDGDFRSKDGQAVQFFCGIQAGDAARRAEAEVVQQFLQKVGLDMQLKEVPAGTTSDLMRQGKLDMALFNWTYGDVSDPDASATLSSAGPNNFCHYANPQVDQLLQQGLTALNPEQRVPIYQQIQQIVAQDVPFLFIMIPTFQLHFASRVKGLPTPGEIADLYDMYRKAYLWSLDPAS